MELDDSREVLNERGRELLFVEDAGNERKRHRRFEVVGVVSLPNVARRILVIPVDEIVEIEGADLAASPAFEMRVEFFQGQAQIAFVSDARSLPNEQLGVVWFAVNE